MQTPEYESFAEMGIRFVARPHEQPAREVLDLPSDWRGPDMVASEAWAITLSPGQLHELHDALTHAQAASATMATLTRDVFPLPTLAPLIADWTEELRSGRGFILVRGLDLERYTKDEASLLYWGLGIHMGIPCVQNPQGELLGHVTDYGEKDDNPYVRAYRTADHIAFHVDMSDVVSLLCWRPAVEGGASRIVSSVAIYNEILRRNPELIETLYQNFAMDRRGEEKPGENPYLELPLCRYGAGRFSFFWHSDYIRSAQRHEVVPRFSPAQAQLVEMIDELAASPEFHLDMDLQRGDMQFVSNHVTLHSRTGYTDHEDPSLRRHLLRLWLSFR